MPNKKVKEPFFHILQPKIQFPDAKMQEVFSYKKEKKQDTELPQPHSSPEHDGIEKEKDKQMPIDETADDQKVEVTDSENATEIIEKFETETETKNRETKEDKAFTPHFKKMPSTSFKRLKSFKEMNTEERLNYLLNFPIQLPPVPCTFETDESTFRGVLIGKTEEMIEIKLLDGKTKELQIQSIKEIRMVGLRK